uniref:Dpf-2 n=1 Tax=Pristionchus pacificus TaxID=54126 RepID=A0A8R1Z8U9_PRIPA
MPPRDAPQFPEMLAMVKALRCDTKACAGVPFSKLALRPKGDGTELLALGTLGGLNQTLLVGDVTEKGCSLSRAIEPLTQPCTLTPAAILQAERQRSSVVGGVSHLSIARSGVVYMATAEKTIRMDLRGNFTSTKIRKTVLDVLVCPSDSRVAAVTADQSLMIIKEGEIVYEATSDNKDISNGIPPFIIQEEMERFNGMWWSPSHSLLLYERVNEEKVQRVLVSTRQAPMKYPLAGTKNARSTLRMIHVASTKVHDYGLRIDLHKRYTWMEYITRAGFMADGTTVWVELMDREQRRSSIALIPLSEFEGIDRSPDTVVQEPTLAYTEKCAYWINTHNLTSSCNLSTSIWSLIHGVTGDFATKLLLITPKQSQVITTDDYCVHKNGGVFVDSDKELVYFFAHRKTPMEVHFCVASLSHPTQVEQLTDDEVSCRVDRSARTAAISFSSCFVVWLSSLKLPPHCVVYSLIHGKEGTLPTAQRLCQVEAASTPSSILLSPRLDSPRVINYFSPTSGRTHYAIVHTPSGKGPFPVIHFVYGGPGVQLVRNEWSAWTFLQKYAALGFAAVVIDGRGSDGRGKKWEGVIKNKLGDVELNDQVEGLHIVDSMLGEGVLDMKRVAVHGWSYGGYLSVLALARHPELYRAAVAGGTVVDWSMYDTAYTERYLGLEVPSYASSNLEKVVKMLPDTPGKLMLAHGLQDENVHFRHAELLIELLIKNGKPYNLQLFPSERHGLRHVDASSHFDASMFSFISQSFRSPHFPTSTPVEL